MGYITIPETVTNITNNTVLANKSIEVTDLETHVIICSLRYTAIEARIGRLEDKVDEIILRADATNKLVIRTFLTLATGVVTSLIVTHFKIL